MSDAPEDLTPPTPGARPAPRSRRRRRALASAALAGVLLLSGCGEDAVTGGEAPEGDGEPPQDPRPQDNEQEAPNVSTPDLAGEEEPAVEEQDEDGG